MPTTEQRLAAYRHALDDAADRGPGDEPLAVAPAAERSAPHRTALVAASLVVLVGLVATALALRTHPNEVTESNSTRPIGTWRQGAAPPFTLGSPSEAHVLDDGRVLVLGELPHGSTENAPVEGGIYDPITNTWQHIPPAPISGGATFRVAGMTVMAMTLDVSPTAAALFDIATMAWTPIEIPAVVGTAPNPWTWTGEVLAIVRAGPVFSDVDTAPLAFTMRWTKSDQTWTQGATFPLAVRSRPTTAVSTDRIAVWGGTTKDASAPGATPVTFDHPATTVPVPGAFDQVADAVFTDGGIYDVVDDRWTTISADPQMLELARRGAIAKLDESRFTLVSGELAGSPRIAATLTDGAWRLLPSPSFTGYIRDTTSDLLVISKENFSGPQEAQYLDPTTKVWMDAPATELIASDQSLVALSTTQDNPGDDPLRVWLRTPGSGWQPAIDAPIVNRMDPAVAMVGKLVIILGGDEGTDLDRVNDTWILDLAASAPT
ncbi:MAG: hypothetical protein JWN99_1394 [Ilumatobacteraceae bacterium]|nr:hypothetical protein [Ilumatobacteraceae bacterium]